MALSSVNGLSKLLKSTSISSKTEIVKRLHSSPNTLSSINSRKSFSTQNYQQDQAQTITDFAGVDVRSPFESRPKKNLLQMFVGILMKRGKRPVAQKFAVDMLAFLQQKTGQNPLRVFEDQIIEKLKPMGTLKTKKVAGVSYRIPALMPNHKAVAKAMHLLAEAAAERKESANFSVKLRNEISDIMDNKGIALKKKEDLHKTLIANRSLLKFLKG